MKKIYFWIIIFAAYFLTRLINLSQFPIFTDEAIYTYWAQVALNDPSNRYISLEDGKQPLFIWIAAILQKFVSDPLITTRLVSVLAGAFSLVGIYLLAKTIASRKVAVLSCILYIFLPFTLLYDRLAIFDSLLTMLVIYSVLFTVKLAQNPKFDSSILTGFAIGLGMITKSSANFYLYLLPASILMFDFRSKNSLLNSQKQTGLPLNLENEHQEIITVESLLKRLAKWIGFMVISVAIAQIIYNSLRLSPLFYLIARKNLDFIRPISEVLNNPFAHFNSNIHAILTWLIAYITLPLFILFLVGIFLAYYKKSLPLIYLTILILVPFFAEALFNKVLYPRFMLFYFPFVIILISCAAIWIKEKYKKFEIQLFAVFVLILLMPVFTSFKILTDPAGAKIADSDAGQYLNDWPSGFGVYQIRDFLKNQPQNEDIYVGTEGTFGLLPFALQIYFYGNNKIHIIGFWPVDKDNLPEQILDVSKTNETYFIFNENQKEIKNPNLKLIAKYQKGRGNSYMRLFKITPK